MNSDISPVELLQSVTMILNDLSVKPYQMTTFMKLVNMMSQMKIVGKILEENHLAQLNDIMEKLTKLCKDSDADLEVVIDEESASNFVISLVSLWPI